MKIVENLIFDAEREFYGSDGIMLRGCAFDGPADGESAFKESRNIETENCRFNLRYPFWHSENVKVKNCEMTSLCRAALWYTTGIDLIGTKLHGIKALRECSDIRIADCDIISPEFGWFSHGIEMTDTTADGEYFMMKSDHLKFERVKMKGKYSFQYITDSVFENCVFDTKDAFWHAKNVTVRNSIVKGEYLAWYCENVTFENCVISGTQPLCYCKELNLINCEMHEADLSFEKSQVWADVTTPVISIKNPASGCIIVPAVNEIICDDERAKCEIIAAGKRV